MSVHFLVDEKGNRTGVVLDIEEYQELLEKIEDIEALKMLEKIRENPLEFKNFDDFLKENPDYV